MRSVKISWRFAEHLLEICESHELPYAVADLKTAMRVKPKKFVKAAKVRKTAKRQTKKERAFSACSLNIH